MAVSHERFNSGLTYEQWLNSMTQNKERFLKNYEAAQIGPEDAAYFRKLPKALNVLCLAEDWCGDVINNLPILAKLAQAAGPRFNLRIFKRDANLDIMDAYLFKGEFRSIPTVVFFDEAMNELGRWAERPQIARDEMDEARRRFVAQHPNLADAAKPVPEMSEATRTLYTTMVAQVRAENTARWAQAVVDELKAAVKSRV
jgi:hypothetical protein